MNRVRVRRSDGMYRRPWKMQVQTVARWPETVELAGCWTSNPAEAAVYDTDAALALARDLGRHARPGIEFELEAA
jgi:phosphotransferase system HPr-like phosphotransfer protein